MRPRGRALAAAQRRAGGPPRGNETQLQKAIMDRLALVPMLIVLRNNSGMLQGHTRKVRFGLTNPRYKTGSCDLICVYGGRFVALEVKLPGKKPTANQVAFMQGVRDVGGFACVVDSVESAVAAIERARLGEHQ